MECYPKQLSPMEGEINWNEPLISNSCVVLEQWSCSFVQSCKSIEYMYNFVEKKYH